MNRIGIIAVALCAFASFAVAQTKTGTTTTPTTPPAKGGTPPATTPSGTKPADPAKPATGAPAKDPKAGGTTTTTTTTTAPADTKPAQPAGPMAPPKPAAELEQVKWIAKNWKCSGKQWDPMTGAESPAKSTIKAKWSLDKHWIVWDYSVPKTKTMPKFDAHGVIGIDQVSKKAVFIGVDNMGSWLNLAGTPGDTIAFEGDGAMMGMKTRVRFTFAKVSDKEHTETFEVQMGKEWKKMSEETCK